MCCACLRLIVCLEPAQTATLQSGTLIHAYAHHDFWVSAFKVGIDMSYAAMPLGGCLDQACFKPRDEQRTSAAQTSSTLGADI